MKGDDAWRFLAQADELDPAKLTFLDPNETGFSVNPFELPPHDEGDEEKVRSVYTGFVMKVIEEWYGADPVKAPRMLRIFRSLISFLYNMTDAPTFVDLHDLVVGLQSGDEDVLKQMAEVLDRADFDSLKKELGAIADMKSDAFDPVLTRLSEFAVDPYLRRLFGAVRHSSVDFAELLEPGRQTIVRIPSHEVGLHIGPLIQSVVLLKLWFAVLWRATRTREEERTPLILWCLPHSSKVLAEDGREHEIGEVVERRIPLKVWSYNIETGMNELKRITGYHKLPLSEPLVEVTTRSKRLICTASHRVYTRAGYKTAASLKRGLVLLTIEADNKRGCLQSDKTLSSPNALGSTKVRRVRHNTRGRVPLRTRVRMERAGEADTEPLVRAERVLHVQILHAPALHGFGQRNQERRVGGLPDPVVLSDSPLLDGIVSLGVQESKEGGITCLARGDFSSHRARSLVHGRRRPNWRNSWPWKDGTDSYERLHVRGERFTGQLATQEMGCQRSRGPGYQARPVVHHARSCWQRQVVQPHSAVCTSLHALQAPGPCTNCNLRVVRKTVCAEQVSSGDYEEWIEGDVFAGVQSGEIEEDGQAALETQGGQTRYVYDIDVEGNHNFFADGILVHNCDEFQDLQRLQAIQTILSQARSQGLCLILSQQTTAQLDDTLLKIVISNCAVQAAGRVSGDDAARLARAWDPQYKREIEQALVTQPDFTWTFRLRAGPGEEQSPPVQERLLKPPEERHSEAEIREFCAKMKELYGADRTERSVFDKKNEEKPEWTKFLLPGQPVPTKEVWWLLITEEAPPRLRTPSL